MGNTLNVAHLILGTEALLALQQCGVHPSTALDAINSSSGRSLQTQVRLPEEVLTRRFNYGFQLGLMQKDCAIGRRLLGTHLPGALLLSRVAAVVDHAAE